MVEQAGQLGTGTLPPLYENDAAAAAAAVVIPRLDSVILDGGITGSIGTLKGASPIGSYSGSSFQSPSMDTMYIQYLRESDYAMAQFGAFSDQTGATIIWRTLS
ncbi:hypothetical protein MLD38_021985 [Melastoma candidum]|uniref:Uncharacterized protein n=1 Tax=Melastoma candidum TaxID=119954 RepID=A0ACB9QHW9_9MYRT|nr:hypothetical protein MLD38_021985 [Melastoma candidum]